MNNLYVVSSPLQLFNAIEARDRFHAGAGEANRLLLLWTQAIDRDQMAVLLDSNWTEIRWYRLKGWRRGSYHWLLRRWLARQQPLARIYLGYPYNLRAHLANTHPLAAVTMLDDGHASLAIASHLADRTLRARDEPHLADRLLGRRTGLGYAERLCFFSVYALPQWPAARYVANDYRNFRERARVLPRRIDELLFIGTPLAGAVVRDRDDETALLHAMAAHYAPRRVRYAAHRYEDLDALRALPGLANIEFFRYDTLLEYALFREGSLPGTIATYCSSAIDTLRRIYPLDAEVLRIPASMLLPEKVAVVEDIYRHHALSGIPVVEPSRPLPAVLENSRV